MATSWSTAGRCTWRRSRGTGCELRGVNGGCRGFGRGATSRRGRSASRCSAVRVAGSLGCRTRGGADCVATRSSTQLLGWRGATAKIRAEPALQLCWRRAWTNRKNLGAASRSASYSGCRMEASAMRSSMGRCRWCRRLRWSINTPAGGSSRRWTATYIGECGRERKLILSKARLMRASVSGSPTRSSHGRLKTRDNNATALSMMAQIRIGVRQRSRICWIILLTKSRTQVVTPLDETGFHGTYDRC